MDQVLLDADKDILMMRDQIENMWLYETQRLRRSLASKTPGFTLAGDNVGRGIYLSLDQ